MADDDERSALARLIATVAGGFIAGALWRRWRRGEIGGRAPQAPPGEPPAIPEGPPGGPGRFHPIPGLVIGSFKEEEQAIQAMRSVREQWKNGFEAYAPHLNEHFFEAMNLTSSPTRIWVLLGGIVGLCGAWATTIMLSIYWAHPVANMPIIAVPPFTIIGFELMVLFGAAGGVLGLIFHGRMVPTAEPGPRYLDRFKRDRIGLVLNCRSSADVLRAEKLLGDLGADEIQRA
ncbi:MAG: quinol:electron acceptor oxidoreductase subunit ActD [Candidatus Binataceae bacterium]